MRALALLLTSCLALGAHAQAPAPSPGTLRWTVATGGGWSERVFYVFEGAPAAPRQVVERWTLEVGAADHDGRLPARWTVRAGNQKPEVRSFVLSQEAGVLVFRPAEQPTGAARPVVQRDLPPRPLSMERVPCTSALLGGGGGLCAAVAGGPLSAPFFPLSIVVDGGDEGADKVLFSFAVTVMTAGLVIPGHRDTSVVATLDAPPPPPLPPLLAKWRTGPRTAAAVEDFAPGLSLDGETAGAMLVLAPTASAALVEALALRVEVRDLWSLLRLARQRRLTSVGLVAVVARLTSAGRLRATLTEAADARALEESALAQLEAPLRAGIDGLIAGRFATFRTFAARAGTPAYDARALEALQSNSLEPGEGAVIAALLPVAVRARALPRFLERLPDDEGIAVMKEVLDGAAPAAAASQLERLPAWVDRQISAGRGKALFDALAFDEPRVRVLSGTLTRAPEAARPALLVEALRLLVFDDARAQVLGKWRAVLPRLTLAQQQAALGAFSGTDSRLQALRSLVADLDDAAAKALVLWVARGDPIGASRVAALTVRPGLTFDAAEAGSILSSFTFDGDRVAVAQALLGLTAEAARPALLVDAVRRMTFDSGRLDLLRAAPVVIKRLDASQRAAVLAAFDFEKDPAAALLGR